MSLSPILLSLQVTVIASLLIFIIGIALAVFLVRWQLPGRLVVETLINLPLVLPPTVIGYYLLFVMGRGSFLFEVLNVRLLFTPVAAIVAATIVGLPLMIQTSRAALNGIDMEVEDAARADGASEFQVLRYVTLPLARRGILAGMILGSARALGDFGTTLMVAGNIPGQTQTLSLAIYDAVQNQQYTQANFMVLLMTSLAFTGLWVVYRLGATDDKTRKGVVHSRRKRKPLTSTPTADQRVEGRDDGDSERFGHEPV